MVRKILIGLGITAGVVVLGLFIAARMLSGRVEPLIRAQVIEYLEKRFDSDVELGSLRVSMNMESPVLVLLRAGKGVQAHVTGTNIKLWHKRRHDVAPLIKLDNFRFQVELNSLLAKPYRAEMLRVEGLHITVPPRPKAPIWKDVKDIRAVKDLTPKDLKAQAPQPGQEIWVIVDTVICDGTKLTITPRDANKSPLEFDIRRLRLTSAGPGMAMSYKAELTNPKPPGLIFSDGHFGPWVADEPSATALDGIYDFQNADLGVFKGISGKLNSTGKFEGQIDHIIADGDTRTPEFRLTMSGNPMNLTTTYHAVIDGGNGNTLLEPVEATLGHTRFTVRGGVVRNKGEAGKTVSLDVKFREGHIEDLMRLSMKGPAMMKGPVDLKVKMVLPPGKGEVADKLQLFGSFILNDGDFTSTTIQDRVDSMSSKAQGRPEDPAIKEVRTQLAGDFKMAKGVIEFPTLGVRIPGADLDLAGKYLFENQAIDFRGKLRLEAKLSQTQTGWKRWVLKPADRFFAKEGAGMLVRIKIEGTRDQPKFSRDKDKADPTDRSTVSSNSKSPATVSQLRD
jgi:hypothetical protein